MQTTSPTESINTCHSFLLSVGNSHCVGGLEAGEVEKYREWGGNGKTGDRRNEGML